MRIKNLLMISLVLLAYMFNTAEAFNSNAANISVKLGERLTFESKVLKESRELLIHLPAEYNQSEDKFPVIYLLDGGSHFQHAVTAASILVQNKKMPASIIVGITNNTRKRSRDAYSERNNFIQFLENEVTSLITSKYRVSEFKTLFGHSAMGFVALELFANKKNIFDYSIVASPAIDHTDENLMQKIKSVLGDKVENGQALFFSATDKKGELEGLTDGVKNLDELLKVSAPKEFKWEYLFIPQQTHMTTPYLTMYQGLNKTYDNFPKLSETCMLGLCF